MCGTLGAFAGFAAGYLSSGSLLVAAGLATFLEVIGFYSCVGIKTTFIAWRATGHLVGWYRLAAAAWHAVREQLASCAVAELLDDFLIRPWAHGRRGVARPRPGPTRRGMARICVGKVIADVSWYSSEAVSRWSIVRSTTGRVTPGPYVLLDPGQAVAAYHALATAFPDLTIYYAVKANPNLRLLAALHQAGCGFEVASWTEVRAVERVGGNPADALFTHPVKLPTDVARARKAGVWRFAADTAEELGKLADYAPGCAVLLRMGISLTGGAVGDQGKFGAPPGPDTRPRPSG